MSSCYYASVNASLPPTGVSRVPDHLPDHEAWRVCRRMRRKHEVQTKRAHLLLSVEPLHYLLHAQKNFIYTMYKTCRFLSDAWFCFVFLLFFLPFILFFVDRDVTVDQQFLDKFYHIGVTRASDVPLRAFEATKHKMVLRLSLNRNGNHSGHVICAAPSIDDISLILPTQEVELMWGGKRNRRILNTLSVTIMLFFQIRCARF